MWFYEISRWYSKEKRDSIIKNENDIKEKLLNNNNLLSSENNIEEKNNETFGETSDNKKSEKKNYVELNDIKESNE